MGQMIYQSKAIYELSLKIFLGKNSGQLRPSYGGLKFWGVGELGVFFIPATGKAPALADHHSSTQLAEPVRTSTYMPIFGPASGVRKLELVNPRYRGPSQFDSARRARQNEYLHAYIWNKFRCFELSSSSFELDAGSKPLQFDSSLRARQNTKKCQNVEFKMSNFRNVEFGGSEGLYKLQDFSHFSVFHHFLKIILKN